MNLDRSYLAGLLAGSATAALCGYVYYKYCTLKMQRNRKHVACQTNGPETRSIGVQYHVAGCDKKIQCCSTICDKNLQVQMQTISKSTQAGRCSTENKETSSYDHFEQLDGLCSTASQTEAFNWRTQGNSSDIFYDVLDSQEAKSEVVVNHEEMNAKTASIMTPLKAVMGTVKSSVAQYFSSIPTRTSKATQRDKFEKVTPNLNPRSSMDTQSQMSTIRSQASLDDVMEDN